MVDTTTHLGKLKLQNPIVTASGTFGNGIEFADFLNLDKLGAITLKSITLEPKTGNLPPRILETPSGMLNSIGLENKGLNNLIENILPQLEPLKKVKIIGNIAGHSVDENIDLAKVLEKQKKIEALEVNISCPNVDAGGLAFCNDLVVVEKMIKEIRQVYTKPLIVKLSVSVSDYLGLAETAIKSGADILTAINTVLGLEVDLKNKRLYFQRGYAGLSGPAIRPIALKAVYDLAQSFDIPIIGAGGVATIEDVIKFIIVGANAVSIGMMNFVEPDLAEKLADEYTEYVKKNGMIQRI